MKPVTIKDIAARSGYSISTVSKTLNGTDRVGAEAMETIRRIADEMGYRRNLSARMLVKGVHKIAIILFEQPKIVRNMFENGFKEAFSLYENLGFIPEYYYFNKSNLTALNLEDISTKSDAMIIIPGEDFPKAADTLDAIGKKIPLVFLQSKQPGQNRVTHLCDVTVDARTVGRMAAKILAFSAPSGEVAMISGCNDIWIHSENRIGFFEGAKAYGLTICAVEESFDSMDRTALLTNSLLDAHPNLSGIFASSYVSPAVCNVLKQRKKNTAVVGVDLFGGSIDCLREGTLTAAIFQNQKLQARLALDAAVNALRGESTQHCHLVKPELVFDANLDGYLDKEVIE